MNYQEIIQLFLDLLYYKAGEPLVHRDYQRTVEVAKDYKSYTTGEGQKEKLQKFFEDTEHPEGQLFTHRLKVSVEDTCYITKQVDNVLKRIERIPPILFKYEISGREDQAKTAELINNWCGYEKTLLEWLTSNFNFWHSDDPNAWWFLDAKPHDPNESVKLSGHVVPAEEVINYEIDCNETKWVLLCQNGYYDGNMYNEETRYILVGPNHIIEAKHIKETEIFYDPTIEQEQFDFDFGKKKPKYRFTVRNRELGFVPACRIGFEPDKLTRGRTYINHWECVKGKFEKLIFLHSEGMVLIQKYLKPIIFQILIGEDDPHPGCDCNMASCLECGPKLIAAAKKAAETINHASSQLVKKIDVPSIQDLLLLLGGNFDLSKMYKEFTPPIELINKNWDAIDREKEVILQTLTGVSSVTMSETLGEEKIKEGNKSDILQSTAGQISFLLKKGIHWAHGFLKAAETSGVTGEVENITIQYPKDFRTLDLDERLMELKLAQPVVSQETFNILEKDYLSSVLETRPNELRKILTWQRLNPLHGKSDQEIAGIIGLGITESGTFDNLDITIGTRIGEVRALLEANEDVERFLSLPFNDQRQLARQYAASLIGFVEEEIVDGSSIVTPIDIEAEAKAKLKGTVGGVQGIIQINSAVARGEMTEESAEALLVEIYGFGDEVAKRLIEVPTNQVANELGR